MTAVCYVNKMGGTHSLPCNIVAREIWLWAKKRNLWLSANHIAGSANFVVISNPEFSRITQNGNSLQKECDQSVTCLLPVWIHRSVNFPGIQNRVTGL